jgi:hypothetical protein
MYAAMLVRPPLSFLHQGGDFSARNAAIASVSQGFRDILVCFEIEVMKRNIMLFGEQNCFLPSFI